MQLFKHDPRGVLDFWAWVNKHVKVGVPFMRGYYNLPMPYRKWVAPPQPPPFSQRKIILFVKTILKVHLICTRLINSKLLHYLHEHINLSIHIFKWMWTIMTTHDNCPPLNMLVMLSWLHLQCNIQFIPNHATNHVTCKFVDMALSYELHSKTNIVHSILSASAEVYALNSTLYIPCEVLHLWRIFGFGVWRDSSTNEFMANCMPHRFLYPLPFLSPYLKVHYR